MWGKSIELQRVLTKSECIIKARPGLYEDGEISSEEGLIVLQLIGSLDEIALLENKLNLHDGVTAKNFELSSEW